jgi:hypothetical protein
MHIAELLKTLRILKDPNRQKGILTDYREGINREKLELALQHERENREIALGQSFKQKEIER